MGVRLKNVDEIVTSGGQTLDVLAAVGAASSGGSGASADFVATGNISAGQTVGLRADGTVEVIQDAVTTATQTESAGSPVVYESADTIDTSATFDSSTNKVVIAYRNLGNSNYGTAVVGEVSGSSISFGTPVVFQSASTTTISATFDSNTNKVVIAYANASSSAYGTAVVGTVSGNSISFGTPVVFSYASTSHISATFDSNLNKAVVAYRNSSSLGYGTAVVGTVSGNSISFGSPAVFKSASIVYASAVFDSNLNKVVIAYQNSDVAGYGTAVVGEVSGNSISFGNTVVFNTSNTSYISATFDSNINRVVIAYRDNGNSSYGTAVVGEVSGSSISFGTPKVFESAQIQYISTTFIPI